MSEPLLLTVEQSDGQSRTRALEDGIYDIGRGLDNAIGIQDQGISRRHARLDVAGNQVSIEDLGSKNGVLVNGRRIQTLTALHDGDQVVLGLAFLTLHRQDSVRRWIEEDTGESGTLIRPVESGASELHLETVAFDQNELIRATDDVKRLWLLYHTGRAASSHDPLQSRLRLILDYVRMALDYERGLLLLAGEPKGRLKPVVVRSTTSSSTTVDAKLVAKVMNERAAVLASVVDQFQTRSGTVRSVLCVPLCVGKKSIGVLYAEAAPDQPPYTSKDLDLLTAMAGQAAFAVENDRLIGELKTAHDRLVEENVHLKQEVRAHYELQGLIARSPAMEEVKTQIRKLLHRETTILILGESGTGKEVTAKTIHYNGPRADRPFVALNCAAIPESLLEAELFGIEAGVATGVQKRIGRFEQAANGTLFLDEIGELSPSTQAKLLRILEERQFERVGGQKSIRVEARIITATNRDLLEDVKTGRFREDLYYRLAVVPFMLPALRKRREDIPALAEHFLGLHATEPMRLSAAALEVLCAHDWPGNVRELSNEIERAVALADGKVIDVRDLSPRFWSLTPVGTVAPPVRGEASSAPVSVAGLGGGAAAEPDEVPLGNLKAIVAPEVERIERGIIRRALEATGGNKLRAAKLLGLSREGLRKKMKRYGMDKKIR